MSNEDVLKTISDNFLCVRRLPFEVISYWSYTEGDENKKWVDSNGNPSKAKKSLFIRKDGRKFLKEERPIEKGGWWYVKQVENTGSTVRFSREYDKFFAPTLIEAVELFIKQLNKEDDEIKQPAN